MDQCRISCQVLHFLVGNNNSANGFSKVDQQGRVPHVVPCDLSLVIPVLREIFFALRAKDWQTDNSVANHDCTVLDKH